MIFYFSLLVFFGLSSFGIGVPVRSLKGDPNLLKAFSMYKRLESHLPQSDLKAITTVGILNGLVEAEQKIEAHLVDILKEMVKDSSPWSTEKLVPKIADIERQLIRDHTALEILTSALDLVTGKQSLKAFQKEMQETLLQARQQNDIDRDNLIELNMEFVLSLDDDETINESLSQRIKVLKNNILHQVNEMKGMVEEKVETTLRYLFENADQNGLLAGARKQKLHKRNAVHFPTEPVGLKMIKSLFSEEDSLNSIDKAKDVKFKTTAMDLFNLEDMSKIVNQNISKNANQTVNSTRLMSSEDQEFSAENLGADLPMGGGGLVGLIGSLSGGEGGSDIGALIGALTGIISNLFGPNGLDIQSLISTGTSLISGLLAGNKNFGTVLGIYVGTAVDGLSGGGGAINNGKFFGNFLGTVVASLSADPEEDDVPPKPFVFLQNLLHSFLEAKNRKLTDDDEEGRRSDDNGTNNKEAFDSSAFVKHIVSSVANGIVSIILNASLGASGGVFQASANAFSGNANHKPSAHNKIWYN